MKHHLRGILRELDCFAFELEKFKTFAKLSLPDVQVARLFLHYYGVPNPNHAKIKSLRPLRLGGQRIYPSENKTKADKFVVLCLQEEDARLRAKAAKPKGSNPSASIFRIERLDCGLWRSRDSTFSMLSYYRYARHGRVCLGRKSLAMVLAPTGDGFPMRMDVDYRITESAAFGSHDHPSVTFTLTQAPVFSRVEEQTNGADFPDLSSSGGIADMLSSLSLSPPSRPSPVHRTKRVRTSSLHEEQTPAVAAHCWVYRVAVAPGQQFEQIKHALKTISGGPSCITWLTSVRLSTRAFREELRDFEDNLMKLAKMPSAVKFQLHRLVSNGFMPPNVVFDLLLPTLSLTQRYGQAAIVNALMTVSRRMPFPGPGVSPSDLSATQVMQDIGLYASKFNIIGTMWDLETRHQHLGIVHRVYCTPTGLHLEGPQLETMNRVLRKYPNNTDHFLRVTFSDEAYDLLPMQPDPQSEIYEKKFRTT